MVPLNAKHGIIEHSCDVYVYSFVMKYALVNHVNVVICAINHYCHVCVERCCAIDDLVA